MNQLPQQTVKRICDEAEAYGKLVSESKANYMCKDAFVHGGQSGYISGATSEAQRNRELEKEVELLKAELEEYKKPDTDPYWYWPQCDVDGCEGVSCCGGTGWRETGYWSLCPNHSKDFKEGKPQPKMRQSAIDKEATRDKKTGFLP